MSKRSDFVFKALHVISWIIFIGLSIEAGALLFNFIFSIFKPEAVHNLYQKLDLSDMYNRSRWVFYGLFSFILALAFFKAHLFYIVIRLLSKFSLEKPFSRFVSEQITTISYYTFSIGIISYIGRQTAKNMTHYGISVDNLDPFWADSQAFILMAAVVYVIAAIFQKGVEIQEENELTV